MSKKFTIVLDKLIASEIKSNELGYTNRNLNKINQNLELQLKLYKNGLK